MWTAVWLGASTDRVIAKTGEDDWESRHAHHRDGTTDAIADTTKASCGGEAGSTFLVEIGALAFHLDDQGLIHGALQTQTADTLEVSNGDRVEEDVDHVGIVPDAFGRQEIALEISNCKYIFISVVRRSITADFKTIDAVVVETISSEQRTSVCIEILDAIHFTRLTADIATQFGIHGVCIDGQCRTNVVLECIVDEDRLCTADKDCSTSAVVVAERIIFVRRSAQSIDGSLATHPVAIVFKDRVSNPRVGLLKLEWAECFERTFQARDTTSVSDDSIVEADIGSWGSVNSAPVASFRVQGSSESVVVRIERTARTEAIVLFAGEHDPISIGSFSEQLRALTELDASTFDLDNATWIDREGRVQPWSDVARGFNAQSSSERAGAIVQVRIDGRITDLGDQREGTCPTRSASVNPATGVAGLDGWKIVKPQRTIGCR